MNHLVNESVFLNRFFQRICSAVFVAEFLSVLKESVESDYMIQLLTHKESPFIIPERISVSD